MAKDKTPRTFLARSRAWAEKNKIFGPQAFLRYVTLSYLDALSLLSKDFVFKGGNLLWVYIHTPRATVDLDLSTLTLDDHVAVQRLLAQASERVEGIRFSVVRFKKLEGQGKQGAAVTMEYETDQGAKNRFDLDIVYCLPTDTTEIASPVAEGHEIKAASIENIVVDKLSTCHRFRSGNTRMKDFDDLWRLAKSETAVDFSKVAAMLKGRSSAGMLDLGWINPVLENAWRAHSLRYKDLPADLGEVFDVVNSWLENGTGT